MGGLGCPDFAILKPVECEHRDHPWREGNGDFERVTRLYFQGIWHARNTTMIWSHRILDLSGGSFVYFRNESIVGTGPYFHTAIELYEY